MTPERQQSYDDQARAEIFVAEHAHGIRANSRAVVATMREYYGLNLRQDRLFILPHGMEDRSANNRATSVAAKNSNFIDVLYAGRFEGRKGTDVLLQVIPALCAKNSRARFTLVGEDRALPDGATLGGAFRDRHRHAAFRDRVFFTGEIPDEKLEIHLAQCDIFVAPSRYESFGLVFQDAIELVWRHTALLQP